MATSKSTTKGTSSKAKTTAVKLKEARAQIKMLKAELDQQVQLNNDNLNLLSAIESEAVPKDVLRNESLNERMNWWFKDLSGRDKVVSQLVMMVIVALITFGAYSGSSDMFSGMEGQEILSTIITLATGALGVGFQFSGMKTPKQNQ